MLSLVIHLHILIVGKLTNMINIEVGCFRKFGDSILDVTSVICYRPISETRNIEVWLIGGATVVITEDIARFTEIIESVNGGHKIW